MYNCIQACIRVSVLRNIIVHGDLFQSKKMIPRSNFIPIQLFMPRSTPKKEKKNQSCVTGYLWATTDRVINITHRVEDFVPRKNDMSRIGWVDRRTKAYFPRK
jgi:hypothetical protein